jgi:hypothetical protein
MSVSDQTTTVAKAARHILAGVKLSSQLVDKLAAEVQRSAQSGSEFRGLLFGLAEDDLIHLQSLKSPEEADRNSSKSHEPERPDELFRVLLTASRTDQEVSALGLIGWYSVRASFGLDQSDIAFHNRHFPRLTDLALILSSEEQVDVLLEVYARSAAGLLTQEEHRRGALRLSGGIQAAGPIEMTLSAKGGYERLYLKAYEITKSLDQAERREQWKDVFRFTRGIASSVFWPNRYKSDKIGSSERQQAEETAASLRPPIRAGELPGSPEKKERRTSWISFVAVFVITAGVIIAVFLRMPPAGKEALGFRIESKGDGILLAWNRLHPIVQSATEGILQIDDGVRHREVHLDPEQVANGFLVYRPASDDVTFRLELRGERGETIRQSMRVLDGRKGQSEELSAAKSNRPARSVGLGSLPSGDLDKKFTAGIEPSSNKAIRRLRSPLRTFPEPVSLPEDRVRSTLGASSQEAGSKRSGALVTSKGPLLLDTGTAPEPPSNAHLPDYVSKLESDSKVARPGNTTPPELELGVVSGAKALPNPPPSPPELKPSQIIAAPTPPGNVATAYVPPRPLRQFLPNPRPWIIASQSEVEVEVKLDENGHVEAARLVRQDGKLPSSLIGASLAAARQWTFKPATLRGIKVESNDTIVFRFRPTNP